MAIAVEEKYLGRYYCYAVYVRSRQKSGSMIFHFGSFKILVRGLAI